MRSERALIIGLYVAYLFGFLLGLIAGAKL